MNNNDTRKKNERQAEAHAEKKKLNQRNRKKTSVLHTRHQIVNVQSEQNDAETANCWTILLFHIIRVYMKNVL